MYGNISINEDYCSKTLRLSESCQYLVEEELIKIVSNMQLWLNVDYEKLTCFWRSDAMQAILFALDDECRKRIDVIEPTTQWKLVIIFCKLQKLFRHIQSRDNKSTFLAEVLVQELTSIISSTKGISEMSRERFILLMCMISVLNCKNIVPGKFEQLESVIEMKILTVFDDLDSNELSICYSAMKKINSANLKTLEDKISSKYGFRF